MDVKDILEMDDDHITLQVDDEVINITKEDLKTVHHDMLNPSWKPSSKKEEFIADMLAEMFLDALVNHLSAVFLKPVDVV